MFITDGDAYSGLLIKTAIIEETMFAKGSNYRLCLAILIIAPQWLWWFLVKHFHSIYLRLICCSHILTLSWQLYIFVSSSLPLYSTYFFKFAFAYVRGIGTTWPCHITHMGIREQLMEVSSLFPDQTWVTKWLNLMSHLAILP